MPIITIVCLVCLSGTAFVCNCFIVSCHCGHQLAAKVARYGLCPSYKPFAKVIWASISILFLNIACEVRHVRCIPDVQSVEIFRRQHSALDCHTRKLRTFPETINSIYGRAMRSARSISCDIGMAYAHTRMQSGSRLWNSRIGPLDLPDTVLTFHHEVIMYSDQSYAAMTRMSGHNPP